MWFLKWFASSAFNKCPQALNNDLPGITSSDVKLQIDSKATPRDVQTPASVTLKQQDGVKKQLQDDLASGLLEKASIGEASYGVIESFL